MSTLLPTTAPHFLRAGPHSHFSHLLPLAFPPGASAHTLAGLGGQWVSSPAGHGGEHGTGRAPPPAGYLQQKPLGFRTSLPIPRRSVSLLPGAKQRGRKETLVTCEGK